MFVFRLYVLYVSSVLYTIIIIIFIILLLLTANFKNIQLSCFLV